MACTWKHMSNLSTSRATHELDVKKEFAYKKVHAFLKVMGLMQSHCPQLVPLGLLHHISLQEFLLGGLASYGRSELPPHWLLLAKHGWPSLCSHLGQLSGWWWPWWPPHLSQHLSFLYPPLQFPLCLGFWCYLWSWGFLSLCMDLGLCLCLPTPLVFPLSRCYVCSCHAGILKESQPIRSQSSLMSHVTFVVNDNKHDIILRAYFPHTCCFPNQKKCLMNGVDISKF